MRILLTNNTLATYAGTEMYLRDLAASLFGRGHQPIAYSRDLGPVADELRAASVPVIDDLGMLTVQPDVIHGQHHVETMAALLRFPGVPAIYVCHGWTPWEETPRWHPRIRRFVAVSDLLVERLHSSGIPADRVKMLGNAVDLTRFEAREGLASAPLRALVFTSRRVDESYVSFVRKVCDGFGMALDVVGDGPGVSTARPEELLGGYDLVFASGRSALEALAVGCAVIVCDPTAIAGLVTTKNLEHMRAYNFGLRVLQNPLTHEALSREIEGYDSVDALEVSERIRPAADLDLLVDHLEAAYREAIEEQASDPVDPDREGRAEADYLQWLKDVIADREDAARRYLALGGEADRLRSALEAAHDSLAREVGTGAQQRDDLVAQREILRHEVGAMRATLTWRLRERVLASPWLIRLPARAAAKILVGASANRPPNGGRVRR